MIQLDCPTCGPRDVAEFRYVGERTPRPDPATTDPETWRAYLYLRRNVAGWAAETWLHRAGCRRYLLVERHTVTNAVRRVAPATDRWPEDAGGDPAADTGAPA